MQQLYRHIRRTDGSIYYDGEPISLADAQLMVNDDIVEGAVLPGSFLRVDGAILVIEPPPPCVGEL